MMSDAEKFFAKIGSRLVKENRGVKLGKMMSSPGITYRAKVFAFFHKDEMIFRLGKDFIPKKSGIKKYKLLNPFKRKPPLPGWFRIPFSEKSKWQKLSHQALNLMTLRQK